MMPHATAIAMTDRRPLPADYKPIQELTVAQMLEDPRVLRAMAESAPKHLSPERLLRVMAQAMRKTPKLAKCSPLSLLGAMITCASLGLEPNTPLGHAYLIPFEKRKKVGTEWVTDYVEVNLIIGYQGLIDLARRSGSLVSIHADVVYEGDEFSFEYGSNMHLRHVPTGVGENRRPLFAYAHAKLEDGEAFEVLPYARVLDIRNNTQAYKQAMVDKARAKAGDNRWATTPWIAYEHEMSCKTMVRRLSKWLPKSIEFASAVQLDSMGERGMIDFAAIAQQPALASDPEAASMQQIEQEQEQEQKVETKKAEVTKPNELAKAKATKAEAKQPDPPPPTEEDEREADRMMRAQQEGGEPDQGEVAGDEWDAQLTRMLDEFKAAKNDKDAKAVAATFRDNIVGANERNEISEDRAEALLQTWNTASEAIRKK